MSVTVIVTRPPLQAAPWVERLQLLGVQARALPLLDIEPMSDSAPLHRAWHALPAYALLMFVSANAVLQFFAQRPTSAAAWPEGLLAGSTGPGTSSALRRAGVPHACVVEPPPEAGRFDSEALWQQLQGRDWAGRRVLVLRGEDGRDWLAETLGGAGAKVEFLAAYRRRAATLDASGRALLEAALADPARHLWLLSSSAALATLEVWAPGADWRHSSAWATHPRIAQSARDAGFGHVAQVGPSPQAVAGQLASWPSIQSAPQ